MTYSMDLTTGNTTHRQDKVGPVQVLEPRRWISGVGPLIERLRRRIRHVLQRTRFLVLWLTCAMTINRKTHLMIGLVEHEGSYSSTLRRPTATLTLAHPMRITGTDGEPDVLSRVRTGGDGSSVRHVGRRCGTWVRPVRTEGSSANPLVPFIG